MKSYNEINEKIASGKAVVLTAEEIIGYAEKNGIEKTAKDVDVVTTATFGPMCSSGCFLNFGHSKPKIRMTEAWIDDVLVYSGIAAVDVYLGATQLRHNDPANTDYPGDFKFGGAHVIEKLIEGKKCQLFGLSYGTDEYPAKEIRTWFTLDDINQATMVNPRNCYQNYNVATNGSDRTIHTYLGVLKPHMKNINYCSAGQLSPLLNDPYYRTIGVGTSIWLAGARGHVYSEGTQHASLCKRTENGVPAEGAGTLALTADMKQMRPGFIRGASLRGYGVSMAVGLGIPIPVLDEEMVRYLTVRDRDIKAQLIDYGLDYPNRSSHVVAELNYEELKSGMVTVNGNKIPTGSLSSYSKAIEIANILKSEIQDGDFMLTEPISLLPTDQGMKSLEVRKR